MAWVQNFSWVFVEYVKALVIFLCLIESVASGLHCLIYCLCMYISHLNQYEELEDGKYWTVIARELRQRFNVQKNYILLQNDSLLYYWTPCPTPTSKHQMDLSSCPPLHPILCSKAPISTWIKLLEIMCSTPHILYPRVCIALKLSYLWSHHVFQTVKGCSLKKSTFCPSTQKNYEYQLKSNNYPHHLNSSRFNNGAYKPRFNTVCLEGRHKKVILSDRKAFLTDLRLTERGVIT